MAHEAAHFLAGYLLGVPISGYSLEIGREHTEFAEAKLQQRIFERNLARSFVLFFWGEGLRCAGEREGGGPWDCGDMRFCL